MRIDTATAKDVFDVAMHMRDSDYKEFDALCPTSSRGALAILLKERYSGEDVIVARVDDKPVAIGRLVEARPNVITLAFFATPKLKLIGKPLTRFIRQRLLEPIKAAGVHRIECVSMVGHTEAHRWIRALGLREEGQPMQGYGKNGEAFQAFSWVGRVHETSTGE